MTRRTHLNPLIHGQRVDNHGDSAGVEIPSQKKMGKEIESGGEPATTETTSESTQCGSRTPRLFIKEMVMRNFKSYAGEQRVGPFHKVRVYYQISINWIYSLFFNLADFFG